MNGAWFELSLIAEPGDATLIEMLASHEVGEVVASCLGKADVAVPQAWRARAADLDRLAGVARSRAEAAGLRWLPRGGNGWPAVLNDLDFAEPAEDVGGTPMGLWLRGEASLLELSAQSVAVVGARSCTSYGAEVASELGADLADRGWTVVSGAAYGVDASAHRGALVIDGATIAVLACGADTAYPRANTALLNRVAESGLVISEQAPGATPHKHRFLSRNRIIAALTAGTVVVEAAGRSGSLNTLRWADRLGRACLGIPGPITSQMSMGVHAALRDGQAVVVRGVDDVQAELAAVGWTAESGDTELSAEAKAVRAAMADGSGDVMALAERLGVPVHAVRRAIAQLERQGRARVGS